MKRFLRLGAILCLAMICLSCGDVFRPIIIPNPPKFPNPAAAHTVLTISDNGTVTGGVETALVGSAMVIDVSGDTDVSQKNLGLVPVHAVQQSSTTVLVVNQSVPGANQESLTKLTYSGTTIGSTSTISLPTGSAPNFAATTEANQVYVSMPGYTPPSIAVVNTADNTIAETFQVGVSPVAIAETPDTTKLYVANYGSSTIGAYNTKDRSARGLTGQPTSPPIWLAARSDSQQVFVLEKNGTLAFLNTSTTSGPDTFTETGIGVPGASYMWYDVVLNRVYIPGNGGLTIVDVSQSAPGTLSVVPIATVSSTSRSAGDPCLNDTPGTLNIIGATSLPDASRAYIGSYYVDSADNVCPQATVIDVTNYTVKTIIAIPGFPDATNPSTAYYVPTCTTTRDLVGPTGNGFRLMMAAGGDSSRAYLSSCDGGNVNIIQTATDTYYFNLPAPYSSRTPIPPSVENPPQSPVFMIAGP